MTELVFAFEDNSDRRSTIGFGLTDRALRFAQNYAAYPSWGVTLCAKEAGYSDRGRAAHVRGCELLRDPRVIRAIVHYGGLEFAKALALAKKRLRILADGGDFLSWQDRATIWDLLTDLTELARHANRQLFTASEGDNSAERRAARNLGRARLRHMRVWSFGMP